MMRRMTLVVLMLMTGCATSGEPIGPYDAPTTAVVLLDLQRDLLEPTGKLPVAEGQVGPLLETAAALHASARGRGLPVLRVDNVFAPLDPGNLFRNGATVRGDPGAAWDPRAPQDFDATFEKDAPDAFSNAAFDQDLRARQLTHLVISGVFADGCVTWTTRGALNRGYRVTLISSGVAAGTDDARAKALEALRDDGVEVLDAPEAMTW